LWFIHAITGRDTKSSDELSKISKIFLSRSKPVWTVKALINLYSEDMYLKCFALQKHGEKNICRSFTTNFNIGGAS